MSSGTWVHSISTSVAANNSSTCRIPTTAEAASSPMNRTQIQFPQLTLLEWVMAVDVDAVVVVQRQCAETKIESTDDKVKVKLLQVSCGVIKVSQGDNYHIFQCSAAVCGSRTTTTTKVTKANFAVVGVECANWNNAMELWIAIGHTIIKLTIVVCMILWLSTLINKCTNKKDSERDRLSKAIVVVVH